jgi:hypothetical protein
MIFGFGAAVAALDQAQDASQYLPVRVPMVAAQSDVSTAEVVAIVVIAKSMAASQQVFWR